MTGIYKILSPSNAIYIGQSREIEKRRNKYSSANCKLQVKLFNSLKKYGFKNHSFEVIHELPSDISQETLNVYETLYHDAYSDLGFNMMNIKAPGSRGKHSAETLDKISAKAKLRGNNGASEKRIGMKHSDESKLKMSKNRFGILASSETKNKMSISQKGRVHNEDTKLKMSIAKKGLPSNFKGGTLSESHRKAISHANKGHNQYTRKKLLS